MEEGSEIVWTDASGDTIAVNVASVTITATSGITSNTYNVYVKDINGCEYEDKKQVSIFKATDIYIDGPTHVCPNDEVTLDIKGSVVNEIKWNTFEENTARVTFKPTETATYKVEGTDNNGCKADAEFTVNVYDKPILSVDAPIVCKGEDAEIKVTGADSYSWNHPDLSANSGGEVVLNAVEEDVDIEVTGYNQYGCSSFIHYRWIL